MKSTITLHQAKTGKNDEFYTPYDMIGEEVKYYDLKGKVVYSPCDDYRTSNFVKYFTDNYDNLGLAGYVSTCYDIGDGAYRYEYDGYNTSVTQIDDGDFHTQDNGFADVIITNPPFSLYRDFVDWICDKDYLILGNQNALNYSKLFPLAVEGKMTWGVTTTGASKLFDTPYEDGKLRVSCRWYTNMPIPPRKPFTPTVHYKGQYEFFDGTDIICVDKYNQIPCDYPGMMGVPTSYFYYWNPDEYELLGELKTGQDNKYDIGKPIVGGKSKFVRLVIKKKLS